MQVPFMTGNMGLGTKKPVSLNYNFWFLKENPAEDGSTLQMFHLSKVQLIEIQM